MYGNGHGMLGDESMEKMVPIRFLSTHPVIKESFVVEAGILMQNTPDPPFDSDFTPRSDFPLLGFDWSEILNLRNRMPRYPFFVSLFFFLACSNTPVKEISQPNLTSDTTILSRYRSYVDQNLMETKARLSLKDGDIQNGFSYGNLQDLSTIVLSDNLPSTLYFKDGEFVLLYVSGGQTTYTVASLHKQYPKTEVITPSRAGKRFSHYVVPDKGIAWSDDGEELAFIEIFPSTTIQGWKEKLYKHPGDFYK